MKNIILLTISGICFGTFGIYIGYLFLKSLNHNSNFILLIASLVLIIISIISLYFATNPRKSKTEPIIEESVVEEKTATILEKNNTVLAQWNKTSDTRDKLKILKIAGAENEEETSD